MVLPWYPFHLSRLAFRFLLPSRFAFGGSCLPLCSDPLVWAPCSLLLFVVSPRPRRFSWLFFRLSRASRSSLGFCVFRVSFPCRDALKTPLSCPLWPRFSLVFLCFLFWSCVGLLWLLLSVFKSPSFVVFVNWVFSRSLGLRSLGL